MPVPIPYIDQAKLKSEADQLLPLISEGVALLPVVGAEVGGLVKVLEAVADNDQIRIPVVDLINRLTGQTAPA
jgi:hypothetical protein